MLVYFRFLLYVSRKILVYFRFAAASLTPIQHADRLITECYNTYCTGMYDGNYAPPASNCMRVPHYRRYEYMYEANNTPRKVCMHQKLCCGVVHKHWVARGNQ